MSKFFDWINRSFATRSDHLDLSKATKLGTRKWLCVFACIATTAVLFYSLYAANALTSNTGNYFTRLMGVFGTLVVVGVAAFGVGGVLGFLFRIPKTVSENEKVTPSPEDAESVLDDNGDALPQSYRSNTNLEEISDWLTKIILGATLIELKEINDFLGNLISNTASNLDGVPFAKTIVGAVILAYLILGFFAIYLMTRLCLVTAFNNLENALQNAEAKQNKMQATIDQKFDNLSDIEKQKLKELLEASNNVLTLPNTFVRHSPEHQAWQSLRERGLVELRGGGRWRPGSIATLTELSKEIRDQLTKAVNPSSSGTP